ncbi:hypothetical protein [Nocardia brevicatena]|uniref:hypothetical protein n=1 Tax=Nocardia brevicatena TaxID=37327 RepID=UPI0002EB8D0B|nr:hypothetical protein [Nocardia brevicatena]
MWSAGFDLPEDGGSLTGDLARAGHPVYLVDACGYGRSSCPAELSAKNPPAVRAGMVVRDIAAVVDHLIGEHEGRTTMFGRVTGRQ